MADLNKESMAIWKSLKPMIDEEIKAQTRGSVQRRKMKVTTAPSLVTNVIGVTEPYGTEMLIPFNTNLSAAHVGDVVWVEFMYGATNAFASMYASADTKDWTVGGTLDVTGNTTLGGDLSVAGDESVTGDLTVSGDTTLNGVLDVTQRRCSATLSSAGWYRAVIYNAYDSYSAQGSSGEIVDIDIVWTATNNCGHHIKLFLDYGKVAFLGEESNGTYNIVDKIRYTYSGSVGYIDIHFVGVSSGSVPVHFAFDVTTRTYANSYWVAGTLASVADAPSGETVLTTYEFAANTRNGALLIEDITVGSATLAAGAATSITKSLSKTGYTPIAVAGFYGSGNGFCAVGDCFINASNVLNMYLINTGTSSKTPTMYAKVLWQKD